MKLRKKISEAKNVNIYKTLLSLFAEFCDRFPASSVDRLFDILVQAGTKILPTDKRALDIISFAIAQPLENQTSEVQTFLNLRFGELPPYLRPITKEGRRHEIAFWCRDGKVYDKVRDLVNFSQEKGKGFWGDVDCKKVTLIDMTITSESRQKLKEEIPEDEPEDAEDDRSPARKYVDNYFKGQKAFTGAPATDPKKIQTTANIVKNLFKLDVDTAAALFQNVMKGHGIDVGEALVNIDQPAMKDEKPAEDEVAADNLLEPVDFKKKAKDKDREPGIEDIKDKDLEQLYDVAKFIKRKVMEKQLVELHDLLPELDDEVLSKEEKEILAVAFADEKIADSTPSVANMIRALVELGALGEEEGNKILDYSDQEGEHAVKEKVAELYLKHILLPLVKSDVDVEEAVVTKERSITAALQNTNLTDAQKKVVFSAVEKGVIADELPDLQHIKDTLISAAASKQKDNKPERSSDVLRKSISGQVTEEEIIETWLQEYLLPVLQHAIEPDKEEDYVSYRECVECTKIFKANTPKCIYCNSENTKPIAEDEESPEMDSPPVEHILLLVVEEELTAQVEGLSDDYDFAFSEGIDVGEDVLNWVKENNPETFKKWLADADYVQGDDVLWEAMEALELVKEKEQHYDSNEEEAEEDRWLARHRGTDESKLDEMKEYYAITKDEKKALSIVRMLNADGLEGVYSNRVQGQYEIHFVSNEQDLIKDTIADLEKMQDVRVVFGSSGKRVSATKETEESVDEGTEVVKVKEETDNDNYKAIARGLEDEKDAQEIARNKKGRVVQDDEDENKFMVISRTDESGDTKDWLVFYKDATNPHLDEIAINKTFTASSEDDACKQAQDLLDREAPGNEFEIVRAKVNESLQTRLLREAKKDVRQYSE